MPRLPIPGEDAGRWGNLLNEYLAVEHDADGSLRRAAQFALRSDLDALAAGLAAAYVRPLSGIPLSDLDATDAAAGQVLKFDGNALVWDADSSGSPIPSTSSLLKGDGSGGAVAAVPGTDYAEAAHAHAISDTTGLQAALESKASTSHNHTIGDTTDLQVALDGKAPDAHAHDAAALTSGTLPLERGGTGGADAASARSGLGLGDSATLDVGTGAGTVAAGDHGHAGTYQPAGDYLTPSSTLDATKLNGNGPFANVYNVKSFGAAGDGATDDSAAITAAITAAVAGGTVWFPKGAYLTGPLTISSNATLAGDGATVTLAASATATLLTITSKTNVTVRGLTLDGGDTTDYYAVYVAAPGSYSKVRGTRHGIVVSGSGTRNISINGCTVTGFTGDGISLSDLGTATLGQNYAGYSIRDTTVKLCYNGLHLPDGGEYGTISGVSVAHCSTGIRMSAGNVYVANSMFTNCVDGCQMVNGTNAAHGSFMGCTFNHAARYGLSVASVTYGHTFTGCDFWYADLNMFAARGFRFVGGAFGQTDITIDTGGMHTFTGNHFNATDSLTLKSTYPCMITGNVYSAVGTHTITIDGGPVNQFIGNAFAGTVTVTRDANGNVDSSLFAANTFGSTIAGYTADPTAFTRTGIKLTTGAGANKILTSDAGGEGAWAELDPANLSAAVPANKGGAGTVNGLLRADGAGVVSAATMLDTSERAGTWICFGDSITEGNGPIPGYFALASVLSGQQLRLVRNAGIGGNTTAQMLARVQADVVAYAPAYCIVLGGTNDSSVAVSVTQANLTAIYDGSHGREHPPRPLHAPPA